MQPGRNREEETLDDLLKGRLKIHQKKSGFRYTIDSLLLANFALDSISTATEQVRALDLGAGNGVIPLILALSPAIAHVTGVELIAEMVKMGKRSVSLNKLDDRVSLIEGDIRNPPESLKKSRFDLVVSNPPYRKQGRGRINPDKSKAVARHEIELNLEDLIKATAHFLKPSGAACFIYGAARSVDILSGLRSAGVEPVRIRYVHSRVNEPAQMLLIEARKNATHEVKMERPLLVYRDEKNYSDEVEEIFKGPHSSPKLQP